MNAIAKPVRERAADTAKLLRALANDQRLLILCHLRQQGEVSAGALARLLGMERSALSQHLARMRAEDLIVQSRDGRVLRYRLNAALDARLPALLDSICAAGSTEDPGANRTARAATAVSLAFDAALGSTVAPPDLVRGPAIMGAGQFRALPDVAYAPDPAATYKALFATSVASRDPARVHPALDRVARVVNTFTYTGVPAGHLKFAVVIYGQATAAVLDDTHYAKLFDVSNPNLPVLHALQAHGVDVAVCAQAVVNLHYERTWIDPHVVPVLSALSRIIELGQQGYVLVQL
ncbi:MAG TPA: metalloregulator ArsR/SmtB family transcription factor [Rhodanobacteraceae bacterium]